jgi:protoporphyrinogen oxidase
MNVVVLGGGIAGLSLSSFLDTPTIILESEERVGGLCRSYTFRDFTYDIGPHIIFSKNQKVLDLHNSLVPVAQLQRLNKILIEGSFLKYPFENHLGELPTALIDKCLQEFLNNPYENLSVSNMQQFFLSKFGEGMTDVYFGPYNKKIWKFDPSCLDLQMVDRIPSPPMEDVVSGSRGVYKDGYTHQLHFTYPKSGGFESIINAYEANCITKGDQILVNSKVVSLEKNGSSWTICTELDKFSAEKIVSTIPLNILPKLVPTAPQEILDAASKLLYNSIHIVVMQFEKDILLDQFALYIPDMDIIFHRLSRLNFLGPAYGEGSGKFNVMLEVTFRQGSHLGTLNESEIIEQCLEGLERLQIVTRDQLVDAEVRTFEYAYVIYDIEHRSNVDKVINWANALGIHCHGRFGKFEYQNSDAVVGDSMILAELLNSDKE